MTKNILDAMLPAAGGLIRSTVNGSPSSELKSRSDAAAQASQAPPGQSLPTAEASHLRWPVPLRGLGAAERLRTKPRWSL